MGWFSILANFFLFVMKIWVGIMAGSVSMIADSWHTLSDSLTSIVVVIGFWVSGRPADKEHPFGHGRAELIASIIVATLLAVVGFNFLADSINRLRLHQEANFSALAIWVFTFTIFAKEGMAQLSFWAARKTQSQSLAADAWHHRSDAITSILIVAGALSARFFWWIDGVMGIGVSVLIFYVAISIMLKSSNLLMGQKPGPELEKKIRDIIKRETPKDIDLNQLDLHHMHMHCYGKHIELTLHVRFPKKMELASAHEISRKIEEAIRFELGVEATIHCEPQK